MKRAVNKTLGSVAGIVVLALVAGPAVAQNTVVMPGQQASVPLPPPAAVGPPPPPGTPPKLDTFGDRVTRCLHYGGMQGLPPGQRDAYSRACANN